jgi:hypothetical protein
LPIADGMLFDGTPKTFESSVISSAIATEESEIDGKPWKREANRVPS